MIFLIIDKLGADLYLIDLNVFYRHFRKFLKANSTKKIVVE